MIVSVGEGQKLVWESVEGTKSTTNKIIFDIGRLRSCSLAKMAIPLERRQSGLLLIQRIREVLFDLGGSTGAADVASNDLQ